MRAGRTTLGYVIGLLLGLALLAGLAYGAWLLVQAVRADMEQEVAASEAARARRRDAYEEARQQEQEAEELASKTPEEQLEHWKGLLGKRIDDLRAQKRPDAAACARFWSGCAAELAAVDQLLEAHEPLRRRGRAFREQADRRAKSAASSCVMASLREGEKARRESCPERVAEALRGARVKASVKATGGYAETLRIGYPSCNRHKLGDFAKVAEEALEGCGIARLECESNPRSEAIALPYLREPYGNAAAFLPPALREGD